MIRLSTNHRTYVLSLAFSVPLGLALVAAGSPAGGEPPVVLATSVVQAAAPGKPGRAADAADPAADDARVRFGDAHLRGRLDLGRMRLVEDHYEVPLDGGARAVLTLDPTIQRRAEQVLAQAKAPYGAVVVMAVDGRLLAIAGRSTVEPGLGAALALRPWAPAASVFKIVTSAALLDAGVKPDAPVCYHGGLRSLDASNLVDDPARDGTCRTFTYGLAKSQNAIIAKLAARHLDPATLRRYAAAFGFGAAPRFALPAEPSTADIPDEGLAFARVAAGFWQTHLSPLGGAILADTVASGGLAVTPRIVASVVGPDGRDRPVLAAAPSRVLEPRTARSLARMLTETTRMGTAHLAFHDRRGRPYIAGAEVAGKTGSLSRKEPFLDYSWFVGFAPVDSPRLAISVNLGNSPLWHLKAHNAARLVLEAALAPAAERGRR